ncbi:MAG: hypothetical protein HYS27_06825 [Deltaproteobacteria bacterium]|nr:hypothetical protein [Deltaproteobacteria bacterium]
MPTKRDVLGELRFGAHVAEDEQAALVNYFVETDLTKQIFNGDIDVVFGPKGSGKSAIHLLLVHKANDLLARGVIIKAAENLRGAPAFKDVAGDPPASEQEFSFLWKAYFLSLVGDVLRANASENPKKRQVLDALQEAGLAEVSDLRGRVLAVIRYAKRLFERGSVEGGVKLDPLSGLPSGVTGKISLNEPSPEQARSGVKSADNLLKLADEALAESGKNVWILLDRLDVAFAESALLEENALRALLHVYLDMRVLEHITPKVFLRDDIWQRVTAKGFRESSHITRQITISWTSRTLTHLVLSRALDVAKLREYYAVAKKDVLDDSSKQNELFWKIFPPKVAQGEKRPDTLTWILSRTQDGTRRPAPRELIQLLNEARNEQTRMLDLGDEEPPGDNLLSHAAIDAALPTVSKTRLQQTLFAEYPELKAKVEALKQGKTSQTTKSLETAWGISAAEAQAAANQLTQVGFFEKRGTRDEPQYWIPFVYRSALELVQGTASDSE